MKAFEWTNPGTVQEAVKMLAVSGAGDIDEAPRKIAHRSFVQRREQMVGDALQLTFDVTHWNRVHASEDPIVMPLDFTDDVNWRMNAPDEDAEAA